MGFFDRVKSKPNVLISATKPRIVLGIKELMDLVALANSGKVAEPKLMELGPERYALARCAGRLWRVNKTLQGETNQRDLLMTERDRLIGDLIGKVGLALASEFLTEIGLEM